MKTSTLSLVAAAAATISACVAHVSADMVVLAKFNGTDDSVKWKWVDLNDPVMGGQSTSTFSSTNSDGIAVFNGTTRVVPSLKAPGFCNAKTTDILKRANDASAYINDALLVRVRSTIAYGGYFMSFAADTIDPQFKSYKAPFEVIADGEWRTVAIPFTNFSNDWSSFTGRCDTVDPTGAKHKCCSPQNPEVCPSSKNLKDIEAFGIWTEGVAGDFHLEIEWIAAGTVGGHAVNTVTATAPAPPAWKSYRRIINCCTFCIYIFLFESQAMTCWFDFFEVVLRALKHYRVESRDLKHDSTSSGHALETCSRRCGTT
eukprot:m.324772 g.324772  ORF g.324772 m.324772 type:complete len:315 (-) comp20374_c0_seq13:2453-3397(-)